MVAPEETVEHPARVVLGRNRASVKPIGNGAGTRQVAGARVDGQNQRRPAAELLGVGGNHLIQADGVVGAGFRIVERRSGQPHVGAGVGIGLRAARVVEPAHEAELLPERLQWLRRRAELELPVLFLRREPAPFGQLMLGLRQRHAVGRVDGAEAAGGLVGDLCTHGVQHGQSHGNASQSLEECAAVESKRAFHDTVLILNSTIRETIFRGTFCC